MRTYPIHIILFILIVFASCKEEKSTEYNLLSFEKLVCNYEENPIGIDDPNPQLSWTIQSENNRQSQTAYQILVASTPFLLDKDEGDIWDSDRVFSDHSIQITYEGSSLNSSRKYYWKVRIWDQSGIPSQYSQMAFWEMGLIDSTSWEADWISAPRLFDWSKRDQQRKRIAKDAPPEREEASPIFRKEFALPRKVKSARAYISGLGYYELRINGEKVGSKILDPAFTAYDKTVLYSTYDITEYLADSLNTVGVMLGNGWYNMFSRGVWSFDKSPWRNDPVFRIQIRVVHDNGTISDIYSDDSWRSSPGPVTFNSIRQGEEYDARLEQAGWDSPGFFDKHWYPVRKVVGPEGKMTAQVLPPIKITQKLDPVNIYATNKNTWVADFGQNIAGFIELIADLPADTKITFKYGEKLLPDGTVDQSNIDPLVADEPFQTDIYISKGMGTSHWHPRFTYHGFQYVEISGFPNEPEMNQLKANVVSTSLAKKGNFSSSNELLNKIQRNAEWSLLGNYHGYPTDCPHREKNGWTGDAQLASDMALYNYNIELAYDKWVRDIVDSQLPSGMISAIVPTGGWGYYWGNGPAWDYALIIIPWKTYIYSGDIQMLKKYYPAMKKYMDFLSGTTDNYIIRWGLGDWVPVNTRTPADIITTAYYYHDAIIMSKIAAILGNGIEENQYSSLAENIRKAFQAQYMDQEEITVGNGSQAALSSPLFFDMLDDETTQKIVDLLAENIHKNELNLDFGALGSKLVPNALSENGHIETAYKMINTTSFPGWGNWVSQGATTLWEDWKGEGSLNHIFFGDVSAWFYKYLGGIKPDTEQPGFKHFFLQPYFASDLNWVKSDINTLYGQIKSNWEKSASSVSMNIKIPVNTNATVILPGEIIPSILENGKSYTSDYKFDSANNNTEIILGSGSYTIEFNIE